MNSLLFALEFISPPVLKKLLLRVFCRARFGRGSHIGWFSSVMGSRIEFGDFSVVKPFTLIRCDGKVKIGKYTEISSFSLIYGGANFEIRDKCYLGPQSLINVTEDVLIGNEVGIGARTMIYTHGSFLPYTEGYWVRFGRVCIGNRVWLAAGVFIHPGVEIGNDVFVNSRSVITENVPSGKVMEGFPAKEIVAMDKIRRTVPPQKKDVLIRQVIKHFASYMSQTEKEVKLEKSNGDDFVFTWNSNEFRISLVGMKQKPNDLRPFKHAENTIYLLNTSEVLPSASKGLTYYDFATMKASYSNDKLFQKLYLFMKQYYGLIFEYEFND